MKDLTTFQRKCEAELLRLLKRKHLVLENRKLGGQKEIYIYAEVKGLETWIYEDGAEIAGDTVDKRFEKYDFDSDDELINAFIGELESLIDSTRKFGATIRNSRGRENRGRS